MAPSPAEYLLKKNNHIQNSATFHPSFRGISEHYAGGAGGGMMRSRLKSIGAPCLQVIDRKEAILGEQPIQTCATSPRAKSSISGAPLCVQHASHAFLRTYPCSNVTTFHFPCFIHSSPPVSRFSLFFSRSSSKIFGSRDKKVPVNQLITSSGEYFRDTRGINTSLEGKHFTEIPFQRNLSRRDTNPSPPSKEKPWERGEKRPQSKSTMRSRTRSSLSPSRPLPVALDGSRAKRGGGQVSLLLTRFFAHSRGESKPPSLSLREINLLLEHLAVRRRRGAEEEGAIRSRVARVVHGGRE